MEQNRRPPMPPTPQEPINILELLLVLKRKIVWIIIAALVAGCAAMGYTTYRITPLYQASIRMIVNAQHDSYTNSTVADVASAQSLVATYATIIKNNRVLDQVIEELDLNMSWTQLNGMVSVTPVNETPVINITVTSADPQQAQDIVTTISEVAPELIVDAVEAGSCKVISDAYCSGYPVSPNVRKNTMQGAAVGGAFISGVFVLLHLLNDNIYSEDQLEEFAQLPVLSTIPKTGKHASKGKHRKHGRKHW